MELVEIQNTPGKIFSKREQEGSGIPATNSKLMMG